MTLKTAIFSSVDLKRLKNVIEDLKGYLYGVKNCHHRMWEAGEEEGRGKEDDVSFVTILV